MVLVMWFLKTIEYYFDLDFRTLGIFPRKTESLKGIFFSPFIHGSFDHLISNTVPFLLLGTAIFYFYSRLAYRIIFFSWILTGMAVWIGGRYSWHIGASGLVYAFASFLFFAGILNKERQLIAISLLVIFLYGGLIWGVLPGQKGISWESHLFGFLSGFIFAYFYGKDGFRSTNDSPTREVEDFIDFSSSHNIDFDYFYKDEE
jgi:membrane associated rhomboid family serine protease